MAQMTNSVGSAARVYGDVYRAHTEGERNPSVIELNRMSAQAHGMRSALDSVQMNLVQEMTHTQRETTWKVAMEQVVLGIQAVKESASSKQIDESTRKLGVEILLLREELKTARNRGEVSDTTYGRVMEYLDRLPGIGGFVGGAAGSALGSIIRNKDDARRLRNFNDRR